MAGHTSQEMEAAGCATRLGVYTCAEARAAASTKPDGEAPAVVVVGQAGKEVRGWAQVGADSDAFKRTITEALYWHALGHRPRLEDLAEFTAIWQSLPELGWTANATVHAIVATTAFGAP